MKTKAVIFDMDGLMLDSERLNLEVFRKALKAFGYSADEAFLLSCVGLNRTDTEQSIIRKFGPSCPATNICGQRAETKDASQIKAKPGLHECLNFLQNRNIFLAVVSSSERETIEAHLNHQKIAKYFAHIVGGDEVQHGKPNPEGYLKAIQATGFAAEECLILEDSNPGIKAAYLSGAMPIMIPDLLPPTEESISMAKNIFSSLEEALPFLKEVIV